MFKRYALLAGAAALPFTLALAQGSKTVNILGAFGGGEAKTFQAVIDAFEAKNPGIKVNYSTSPDFNTILNVRVQRAVTTRTLPPCHNPAWCAITPSRACSPRCRLQP